MRRLLALPLVLTVLASALALALDVDPADAGWLPGGTITTVAGTGDFSYDGGDGEGGPATAAATYAEDVAVDDDGNLYTTDLRRIRRIDADTGVITTIAGSGRYGYTGDGGPAVEADLESINRLAVGPDGDVFFSEYSNGRVRRVDAQTGILTTAAGTGTPGYNGDGRPATTAQLRYPIGLEVDQAGHLYIADITDNRVRRVDAVTGMISTVAGTGVGGYNGDGPAASTQLQFPIDVALDPTGRLLIADATNRRVRQLDPVAGTVTTVLGDGSSAYGGEGTPALSTGLAQLAAVAVGADGTIYTAERGTHRVRRLDPDTRRVHTVAGDGTSGAGGDLGPGPRAQLSLPNGLALAADGGLLVADPGTHRIRRVEPNLSPVLLLAPGDQQVVAGSSTGPLVVFASDPDHVSADLVLSATSSDQTVVADADVSVTGGVGLFHVEAAAAASAAGSTTITLVLTDPMGRTGEATFAVTVVGPDPLSGTVSDEVTGQPAPGIEVGLRDPASGALVAAATTAPDGTWSVPTVADGSYVVQFRDPSGIWQGEFWEDTRLRRDAPAVVVSAAAPQSLDARLWRLADRPSVTGTVRTPDGLPVPGIGVRAFRPDGSVAREVASATDGSFSIGNLEPGSYRIGFHDRRGRFQTAYWQGAASLATATPVALTHGPATIDPVLIPVGP